MEKGFFITEVELNKKLAEQYLRGEGNGRSKLTEAILCCLSGEEVMSYGADKDMDKISNKLWNVAGIKLHYIIKAKSDRRSW